MERLTIHPEKPSLRVRFYLLAWGVFALLLICVWSFFAFCGFWAVTFGEGDRRLLWLVILFAVIAVYLLGWLLPVLFRYFRQELRGQYALEADGEGVVIANASGEKQTIRWRDFRGVTLQRQFVRSNVMVIHARRAFHFGSLLSAAQHQQIYDWLRRAYESRALAGGER